MKAVISISVLLFAMSVAAAAAPEFTTSGDVIQLTSLNFDRVVYQYEYMLVKFNAQSCDDACSELNGIFSEAATQLKGVDTPIYLAEISIEKHPMIKDRYGVQTHPSISVFWKGEEIAIMPEKFQTLEGFS